jgi:3-methyladenine DNA glycosylase AlkD
VVGGSTPSGRTIFNITKNMKKNNMTATEVLSLLHSLSSPTVALQTQKFFKIGPGHYTSEKDKFIGISTPALRKQLKNTDLKLSCIEKLIHHKIHEVRLFSVLYLVKLYQERVKLNLPSQSILSFYLKNFDGVNNWDLVDSSASQILGHYLYHSETTLRQEKKLNQLSLSKNLWEQRLAIVSTYYFIKQDDFAHTFRLAEQYLNHEHDLIHKATGWMLREVGKRDKECLIRFLKKHGQKMPKVMFRYSVEKLTQAEKAEIK